MVDSEIFRVQIDLGRFFTDHKAKAYVSVNRQWKNVRQFHRHIDEIFDVKKFVLLTNGGVYLPGKCILNKFLLESEITSWRALFFLYFSQRKHRHHWKRWYNSVSICIGIWKIWLCKLHHFILLLSIKCHSKTWWQWIGNFCCFGYNGHVDRANG